MSTTVHAQLVHILADPLGSYDERIEAARGLAADADGDVLDALYRIAGSGDDDERVQRATGEAIASILLRAGNVNDAPLWDFCGPAYLGFDAAVALSQRG